ncbi:ABC transporter ATP-binding protein [Microbacterium aoyamense]|uniref:ABC transporter ATP-binding protein n=1 Tax=Microbacterium aoyamense TaxID=344166 RepID=A0ABN2PBD9_9MICO|nr:ABC transporter ATP-binding protein [Microbacterium aoyamense]
MTERQVSVRVSDVVVRFGGIVALRGVTLDIEAGKVTGLIGPNGAGKSTLLNCMNGIYVPNEGTIEFDGEDLAKTATHRIATMGVARTFQHAGLVESLTVFENVQLGAYAGIRPAIIPRKSDFAGRVSNRIARRDRARSLLAEFGLSAHADRRPSQLPQGSLRTVEVARALMSEPTLLLLDEPAAGLTEAESVSLSDALRGVHGEYGVTMVVVEHNMKVIERLCDYVHVLNLGETLFSGTPAEVAKSDAVAEAYLGVA